MNRLTIAMMTALPTILIGSVAFAQNNNGTSYYAPLYNTSNSPTYYSTQGITPNGVQPIYNNSNTTPPVPLQQMIAGRNAPSYTFGGGNPQPYGFNAGNPMSGVTSIGSLSPQQAAYMRAQQAQQQQAQQYNNGNATQANMYGAQVSGGQYGNTMYQPQQDPSQQAQGQQQGMNMNAFSVPGQQQQVQQPQQPTQRRVVYKERNNPLKAPPRLFDPDR